MSSLSAARNRSETMLTGEGGLSIPIPIKPLLGKEYEFNNEKNGEMWGSSKFMIF